MSSEKDQVLSLLFIYDGNSFNKIFKILKLFLFRFSISMRTVDSLGTSVTDSSLYGSLTDSATTADHKLEQIIDLNVTNAKYSTSDDLLNCNTNITFDNNEEE